LGIGFVAYATCVLFWGFHPLLPLLPPVLGAAMLLVALLSSRRVRRGAHNLMDALLRDLSTLEPSRHVERAGSARLRRGRTNVVTTIAER
jgi:hypothetical protein